MTVEDVWQHFSCEQLEKYRNFDDSEAAASYLAEVLNLKDYQFEARDAIKLDYASYVLEFSKEQLYGPIRTASLFNIAQKTLTVCIAGVSFQDAEATFKTDMLSVCRPQAGADSQFLQPEQIARCAKFFTSTFFAHYRLYQHVFSTEQDLTQYTDTLMVETATVPSLEGALTEDEWQAKQAAEAEAAEAARAQAEAEAQQAAAAAEAEAAEAARAEAEAARAAELARKPATLEEAVEQMVALRLEAEKEVLAAEYKSREAELLGKIDALQAKG